MSKKRNRIKLKSSLKGTESRLQANAPIEYLDQRVRFSFRDCDTNTKKFCIRNLDNNEIKKLYGRMGHFEGLTWQQIRQLPRKNGLSLEPKGSSNFKKFFNSYPNFSTFFHFRVNGTPNPFRVFGAIDEDLCYVLAIDPTGSVNH